MTEVPTHSWFRSVKSTVPERNEVYDEDEDPGRAGPPAKKKRKKGAKPPSAETERQSAFLSWLYQKDKEMFLKLYNDASLSLPPPKKRQYSATLIRAMVESPCLLNILLQEWPLVQGKEETQERKTQAAEDTREAVADRARPGRSR